MKLISLAVAFVVLSGAAAETAAAKKGSQRVGAYRGTTELGGTVSFRITKKRKVVGFTMPKVPYECVIQEQGTNDEPRYDKAPVTIKGPPMKLRGVAKFGYQDLGDDSGPDQGFFVDGKPDSGKGFFQDHPTALKGNAGMFSWNGPAFEAGTEYCATAYVDWSADKVGKKN